MPCFEKNVDHPNSLVADLAHPPRRTFGPKDSVDVPDIDRLSWVFGAALLIQPGSLFSSGWIGAFTGEGGRHSSVCVTRLPVRHRENQGTVPGSMSHHSSPQILYHTVVTFKGICGIGAQDILLILCCCLIYYAHSSRIG